MNLLLHAITSRPETPVPAARGLRNQPLARIDVAGLASWSTEFADMPSFTREDLLEHHRVVTDVFSRVDACLPARFPTVLDAARLATLVIERADTLRQRLALVRGACELAITAAWDAPEARPLIPPEATPGHRYLLERRGELTASEQRRARASELAITLRDRVTTRSREVRVDVCPSSEIALSAALLVPTANLEEVQRQLPRAAPGVRILVAGPWPPYTFASLDPE